MGNLFLKYVTYNVLILFVSLLFYSTQAVAQNETIPGEITTPYPTIINIAIEWKIKGDDNQNGIVNVRFREKGETTWQEAMPLRRVPKGENITLKPLLDTVPGYPDFR